MKKRKKLKTALVIIFSLFLGALFSAYTPRAPQPDPDQAETVLFPHGKFCLNAGKGCTDPPPE